MKKLLLVAYYFAPTATSGAMRPLGFCRYLADYGWDVSVLAADARSVWPPLEIDERLSERLPASVRVTRVPYMPIMRRVEEWRTSRRAAAVPSSSNVIRPAVEPRTQPSLARAALRAAAAMQRHVSSVVEFPDRQGAWFRPAVQAALAGREAYEAIFATGGPWTTLRVGLALARAWRLPLVTDFRDPWTRNPSYGDQLSHVRARAARLERAALTRSSVVVANTEELRQQFVTDYPHLADRFVTITNGFDYVPPAAASIAPPRFDLCHFGTVYGGRAPINLLGAVEALSSEGRLNPANFRLRFIGRWEVESSECNALAERLFARGLVMREAPILHDACLAEMQRAGALLVLQSGFPLQIPAKIYEYIATGRPIAFVGDEGATASLIRRHGLGAASADEPAAARRLLETLTFTGQQPTPRTDRAQFHYRALTATLAARLDDAIGADRRRMRTAS